MGYDPKATLIPKAVKTLANGDRTFLRLMKEAIQVETQSKNRKFSDPATAQRGNRSTDNSSE